MKFGAAASHFKRKRNGRYPWDFAQRIAAEGELEGVCERPPANGVYSGTAPVRVLARGIGQEELERHYDQKIVRGAWWVRGKRRIKIVRDLGKTIEFTDGEKVQRLNRLNFLASSRPVE